MSAVPMVFTWRCWGTMPHAPHTMRAVSKAHSGSQKARYGLSPIAPRKRPASAFTTGSSGTATLHRSSSGAALVVAWAAAAVAAEAAAVVVVAGAGSSGSAGTCASRSRADAARAIALTTGRLCDPSRWSEKRRRRGVGGGARDQEALSPSHHHPDGVGVVGVGMLAGSARACVVCCPAGCLCVVRLVVIAVGSAGAGAAGPVIWWFYLG